MAGAYCKSTQAAVCGAVTQGCCGGRERPPYIVAGNGRRRVSGSLPRGLAARRCKASGPMQICGRGACAASRKGMGRARCGTPPPPAAAPPLTGEALAVCGGGGGGGRWLPDAPAQGRFGAVRRCVMTQGCCGGRERPPYIVAGNGQRRVSDSLLEGLAAGRCKASAPTQICGRGACAASREGIGGARCGTPPPLAAAPPLAGEALEVCGGGGGGRWLADAPAQGVRWPEGTARFCVVHYRAFLGEGSGRDGEIWNLLKRKKYGIIFGDYPNLKVGKNAYIINSINK